MRIEISVPDNLASEVSVPPERLAEVIASVIESNVGLLTEHWLGWFDQGEEDDDGEDR
jgi:hypothetical protein